eukprot:jgi/Chrpa1/23309/Chrysochromulina_OHIO_Genome00024340-RA
MKREGHCCVSALEARAASPAEPRSSAAKALTFAKRAQTPSAPTAMGDAALGGGTTAATQSAPWRQKRPSVKSTS